MLYLEVELHSRPLERLLLFKDNIILSKSH
ncbi:MAG: hypothetical protein ACI9EK_001982 [Psychroserpens sp.]